MVCFSKNKIGNLNRCRMKKMVISTDPCLIISILSYVIFHSCFLPLKPYPLFYLTFQSYFQVLNLIHAPLSAALKTCLLLNSEQYKTLMQVSWKLLLHEDPHVVLSAASLFIAACVRRPEDSLAVVKEGLLSENVTERTASIQRFIT